MHFRPRPAAALAALALILDTVSACMVGPASGGPGNGGGNVCLVDFVPPGSGLSPAYPAAALITGQVSLDCSAVPTSQHVTLTLWYNGGNGMRQAKVAEYDGSKDSYTVTANCYAGRWRLAYSVSVTVAGDSADKQDQSPAQTITTKDCAG